MTRLSKLQRRILEIASRPHRVPIGPSDSDGYYPVGKWRRASPWEVSTVTVSEVATAITGVELTGEHDRSEWRVARRRQHHVAASSISRAMGTLIEHGLIEYTICAGTERPWTTSYLRVTNAGRDAIAACVDKERERLSVNKDEPSVTCPCGEALDGMRSTKRYCSPACRQAAYRVRVEPPPRDLEPRLAIGRRR